MGTTLPNNPISGRINGTASAPSASPPPGNPVSQWIAPSSAASQSSHYTPTAAPQDATHALLRPPEMTQATQDVTKPIRRYQPAFPGEQPAGYEPIPGKYNTTGRIITPQVRPYYEVGVDKRSGLERAVDSQVTPLLAKGSKFASPALTAPATFAGEALAQLGGGPALLAAAHDVQKGNLLGAGMEAAGFLPFGRLGRVAKSVQEAASTEKAAFAAGKVLARTPEEAQAHLLDAAAQARAEGWGGDLGSKGHPPVVARGAATEATGGELGQKIREALSGRPGQASPLRKAYAEYKREDNAPDAMTLKEYQQRHPELSDVGVERLPSATEIRDAQKAGYSEERGLRVRAAAQASDQAGGGMLGHQAAKIHLAGALPREFFGHLKDLTPQDVHQAAKVIDQAPMQFFEKTRAKDALQALADHGTVPTKGDQTLLERAFGRVEGSAPAESGHGFWDKFVGVLNIPRAIRSSGDVSAAFRQGLGVLVTHPNVWRRAFTNSLKSFASEGAYQAASNEIRANPYYPLARKYGVPFSDLEGSVPGQEEAFVGSQAAEHIPLGVGKVVRSSDRAFTGMQNETRMQMFALLIQKAAEMGRDFSSGDEAAQHLGESIARTVGVFTGRGVVPGVLKDHLTTLNALMFSPRLMASRLNLMSPVYYYKLDPFARREALAGARNIVAAVGTVMVVARLLGAQVNFDPRSSNFTKIKVGNTRIDIAGGFSQYVRFAAQEMTREAISSSGHRSHIGWGQHNISDLANATKLFRSKAGPVPSLAWDEASGKDFIGRPVKQWHELGSNAPFASQDVYDAYQQGGAKTAMIAGFLSAIGLGVQSYKDKPSHSYSGGGGVGGFGDNSGGGFDSGGSGFGSSDGGGFGG